MHPSKCSWGLILAMVCMMRAGPARLTCGSLLLEAYRQDCAPVNILNYLQIPQFRLVCAIASLIAAVQGSCSTKASGLLRQAQVILRRTRAALLCSQ